MRRLGAVRLRLTLKRWRCSSASSRLEARRLHLASRALRRRLWCIWTRDAAAAATAARAVLRCSSG